MPARDSNGRTERAGRNTKTATIQQAELAEMQGSGIGDAVTDGKFG
jgi:hypothetical protein